MNKRILLILISLLFLSCGRNESNNKSLVKFSFPRIEGVMSADGGVFIFGRHLQLKDTFSTFLDTSGDKREFEQLLSSGDWNFRAIHFTDGNPLNDLPTYCGQIKAQLSGGTYEFDIKLTKTDCNHPVFAGELGLNGAFSTTNSQLKSLHVYFCSQSAFSAGDNSSCLEDMHLKSFKVVYPRTPVHGVELNRNIIQKIRGLPATDFLHNGCLAGPAGGNDIYKVKIPIPYVNSQELYGLIAVFDNQVCSGAPINIFPIVFDYADEFGIKRKFITSSEMSVLVDVETTFY